MRAGGNRVAAADPGFVDGAHGNFALRDDAPVFARIPGLPRIPCTETGPREAAGPAAGIPAP